MRDQLSPGSPVVILRSGETRLRFVDPVPLNQFR
jgi:hypothetical protein